MSLWDRPILCLVVDRAASVLPLEAAVREAVCGGVDWVQLRDRPLEPELELELESGELLSWCESLVRAAAEGARESGRRVAVVVNRRVDVALALANTGLVEGVHLGFDAVSPTVARTLLGDSAWVGVSTHDPEEVAALGEPGEERGSQHRRVTYAHLAPIFQPLSKPASRPPLGLEELARACGYGIPVLAQGGLDARTARHAIDSGAAGIAVTGSILQTGDPRAVAQSLRRSLDGPS